MKLRNFIETEIRQYINEVKNVYKFVIKSRPGDGFNDWELKNITLFVKNDDVAWCDYKVKDSKVYIDYIQTEYEGHGYGQMIMKYLANIYGYENLVRGSLTPAGKVMRQKLDKYYNYINENVLNDKLLYHSTDYINAINILKSGEIKTYENILKATNQDSYIISLKF